MNGRLPVAGVGERDRGRDRSRPLERGDVMVQVVVALPFLLAGVGALVSAGQHLEARDRAAAAAASAARAGAEPSMAALRAGRVTDPAVRVAAAEAVLDATFADWSGSGPEAGRWRSVVSVDDAGAVTVVVTGTVDYRLPSFGMPTTVEGSATAIAIEAVGR